MALADVASVKEIGTATKVPSIAPASADPASLKRAVDAIKEIIEVRNGKRGNPLDSTPTWRDLHTAGIVSLVIDGARLTNQSTGAVGPPSFTEEDLAFPPAPAGFSVTGGFSNIFLEWDLPDYRNHAYTEVWRSTVDNFGTAIIIARPGVNVYADPVGNNIQYYYWIRHISTADMPGPLNATAGTPGKTALDPTYAIQTMRDQVLNSLTGENTLILGNTVLGSGPRFDNVYVVANRFAVLTSDAGGGSPKVPFIVDGGVVYIDTAIIKDATITSAKIASLVADKITAGTITATIGLTAANITGGSLNINSKFEVNSGGQTTINSDSFVIRNHTFTGVTIVPFRVSGLSVFINEAYITNLTSANIQAGSIEAGSIQAGAITASKLAADSVTATAIAAGAVTAAKINVTALSAIAADLGTVTAGKLTAAKFGINCSLFDNSVGDSYTLPTIAASTFQYTNGTNTTDVRTDDSGPDYALRFYGPSAADRTFTRTVKTGDVTFLLTGHGVVDHYFSLWYRYRSSNGAGWGSWTHIIKVVEPQMGYGAISATATKTINMAADAEVEFGVSITDENGNAWSGTPSNQGLDYGALTVLAVNF